MLGAGWLWILSGLADPSKAYAIARPHHQHEDLFDEDDLLVGFRVGPQITSFTPVKNASATVPVPSSMRFLAGGAVKFVYGLPRFEFDIMWNSRGWVNSEDTVNSLAFPIMGKIPVEIDKGIDFEIGVGYQFEAVLGGADPHKGAMQGVLGSIGISVDFKELIFDFDLRYNYGLDAVSESINGAHNRDLQPVGGLLWHF